MASPAEDRRARRTCWSLGRVRETKIGGRERGNVNRRAFLKVVGVGLVGLAVGTIGPAAIVADKPPRDGRPEYVVFARRWQMAAEQVGRVMGCNVRIHPRELATGIASGWQHWHLWDGNCGDPQGVYSSLWESYGEWCENQYAHCEGAGGDGWFYAIEESYWHVLLARPEHEDDQVRWTETCNPYTGCHNYCY